MYDMICAADTIGVFQIESRAQMTMLPRLRPRCFYDLVIEVAIVRPGPIHGDMVHPYLRRRNGEEPVTYPTEEVKHVLERTLGVPLFQEQAMSLAIVAAGFSADEADQLRRAMAAWKRKGDQMQRFEKKFIAGMLERGYEREFAERCFNQLRGFSEYGFPESHAASFAHIVYVSAWLKRHHPAAFAAALINSQPMGFYAPAQIVRDAQDHGVEVRPVDVNHSDWDCTLEPGDHQQIMPSLWGNAMCAQESIAAVAAPALRLGMRLVKGLREDDAHRLTRAVRERGPFQAIDTLHRAGGIRAVSLRRLASADAFGSMGLDRQNALWHIRKLRDDELPLFDEREKKGKARRHEGTEGGSDEVTELRSDGVGKARRHEGTEGGRHGGAEARSEEPKARRHEGAKGRREGGVEAADHETVPDSPASVSSCLPCVSKARSVLHDYDILGLSLKAHPLSFLRDDLGRRGVTSACELEDESRLPHGVRLTVAGLVVVRQRPATASGMIFMTIEDETGIANLIVRPRIYQRYRRAARHGIVVLARGTVERQGAVVHVLVRSLASLDEQFKELVFASRDFH